jgi:hypothetical protein
MSATNCSETPHASWQTSTARWPWVSKSHCWTGIQLITARPLGQTRSLAPWSCVGHGRTGAAVVIEFGKRGLVPVRSESAVCRRRLDP